MQGSWEVKPTTDLSALTSPALASVPAAAFSAPFKATIPACSPASTFPAVAGNRTFIFQVGCVAVGSEGFQGIGRGMARSTCLGSGAGTERSAVVAARCRRADTANLD